MSAKCLIYADDIKVYSAITSVSDAISLQIDFSAIHNWSLANDVPINLSKCNVISFHRKKLLVQFNYALNQHQVQRVVTISDLGIIMDSALTYQDHIEAVIAKAIKLVGFIKRSTVDFKSTHTIISLYRSIVLPIVTYGSVVWSPFTQTAFDKLEAIQHRLLRYCSLKTNHPLSFLDHDFTPLLIEFKLPTLQSLFKYFDLITAFKIIRKTMVCQELKSLFTQREFTIVFGTLGQSTNRSTLRTILLTHL